MRGQPLAVFIVWFAGLGVLTDYFRFLVNSLDPSDRPLSTAAVCHSEERQRVEGVLIRAADAEVDVPGEPRRSYTCIESCRREASERREHIDTAVVRHQYQRVVPERHVMATVDEDIEGELSQRLWIDDQVPSAGDGGPEIGFFAVTVERAASERAMVGLCWLGGGQPRRAEQSHRDSCKGGYFQECFHSSFLSLSSFTFIFVMSSRSADDEKSCRWLELNASIFFVILRMVSMCGPTDYQGKALIF